MLGDGSSSVFDGSAKLNFDVLTKTPSKRRLAEAQAKGQAQGNEEDTEEGEPGAVGRHGEFRRTC
eukprot:4316694-Lingulodinium_polyedra.AAC.1